MYIGHRSRQLDQAQIVLGYYGNESEVVRELIRERQLRQQERPKKSRQFVPR